ncbi:hypothetical protein [Leuconostoc pseudomesenteroides]|uniref:hypothetical protein n=1 Tax=Leuconostoc pseudomesenteroides TaxID=33968 RepID=UPI00289EAB81|nr:hypothetical protein [Leuconostoc pseudomesenteroides]
MELKKISHSTKNINDNYLRILGNKEAITLYKVVNSDLNSAVKTSWIATAINERAKYVSIQTGVDYQEVQVLIKQQFIINALNNLNKDSNFIKKTIRFSADYVQSVLFSDMAKELEAIKGQSFINEDELNDTKMEISIKETQKELAEDLINQLFTRKDQKAFVLSVITDGKDKTMSKYGYSEKRFNERVKRVESTLKKAYENGDNDYIKSLFGEIIETVVYDVESEMTEDDVLAEMYQNATHQSSFYF